MLRKEITFGNQNVTMSVYVYRLQLHNIKILLHGLH